jgi:hypothetical protein
MERDMLTVKALGTFEQVFDALFPRQPHDAHVREFRRREWLAQQAEDYQRRADHVAAYVDGLQRRV